VPAADVSVMIQLWPTLLPAVGRINALPDKIVAPGENSFHGSGSLVSCRLSDWQPALVIRA
jgi:hypothetical protein